jgi:hypothetical protein
MSDSVYLGIKKGIGIKSVQKPKLPGSIDSECASFWFLKNQVPVFGYKSVDHIAYW